MKYFKFILPFILSLILVFNFSHHSYAAVGDVLTAYEIMSDDDFSFERVLNRMGFVVTDPDGIAAQFIYYIDTMYGHGGGGYSRGEDWVNDTVEVDSDGDLVFSDQFNDVLITFLNQYVNDNPVGYSMQNIYSYRNSSASYFSNSTQYNSFLDFISSISNDTNFVFVPRYNTTSNNQAWIGNGSQEPPSKNNKMVMWYVGEDNNNIDFYLSNGHVNNYNYLSSFVPTHNWINVSPPRSNSTHVPMGNWRGVTINENGTVYPIYDLYVTTNNMFDAFCNANFTANSSNCAIFNTTSRNMPIFAYDSIDAIKVHDTGQPQPYYLGSNFGTNPGAFVINSPLSSNTFNPYNEIVNNVQPGMSAGEVQNIINISISNGESGLGGSGGSDSDDDFFDGLFAGLGSLIKSFFKGIADLLGSIAEGLGNILESITSIIGNLINNFTSEDGSIFGFLKAFMSWLPDPLPELLTSFFVLAVIFGVIKLIKGAFS